MHEEKQSQNDDLKILGIKVHERTRESIEIYDHEFKDDNEEQAVLAGRSKTTHKLFGIPVMKWQSCYDPDNLLPPEQKSKITLLPMNKLVKICLITGVTAIFIYSAGIYTANTKWFNDTFYIKSRQMETLEIKSLKPYDRALFKKANSQYEMNIASSDRYKHYHEYYEKVVERIKNTEYYDDKVRDMIIGYIDGYEERKEQFEDIMFPHMNELAEDGGAYYGTILGSSYPNALLEFDRQELLTYRMILANMYDTNVIDNLDDLFDE